MSRIYQPNINQSVPNVVCVGNNLVDGSISGTVNISVLRFLTLVSTRVSDATPAQSAANGDSVSLFRAGVYNSTLQVSQAAATNMSIGISLNCAAAGLLAVEPLLTTAGMLATQHGLLPAATTMYMQAQCTFVVGRAVARGIGGGIVRWHGTEADGTVIPNATIDENAECNCRLALVSNII